jgi:valyl-tRNA synthetase
MKAHMALTLARSYSPADCEEAVRETWDATGAFHAAATDPGDPYCILIPPPNVTAALHLGHALNNTLQDVLVRVARMRGRNTLWMPGTDHAGIGTQTVVERRLLRQGRRRSDLSREEFVATAQQWKDEYEAVILRQLRAMGCSCDYRRTRYTMDPVCTRAVREAFYLLFRAGLIERGKRLVNWDPVSRTALADDEVETIDVDGHMWYLRYPLVPEPPGAGGRGDLPDHVTVATTRPETMLGDTAVAVHPDDPRATRLVGRSVRLPIVGRIVPIIVDEHVVRPGVAGNPLSEYATGFLKVTPAHDHDDWEIGLRHGLPVINVLAPDATISRDHGWPAAEFESGAAREAVGLLGLSRERARERIVEWFRRNGLLDAVRDYRHGVGHSYRSHAAIEPYLSDQWFVRVTDDRLRGEALRAMCSAQRQGPAPPRRHGPTRRPGDGELTFHPARYARTFEAWHEGLRDWCISRQLWWGHRIPVWSAEVRGGEDLLENGPAPGDARILAAWDRVRASLKERAAVQEPDAATLDPATAARCAELARGAGCSAAVIAAALRGPLLQVCLRREDDHETITMLEAAGFHQDPDVLDTWFSSALWPISTMGWPDPAEFPQTRGLLETFNPSTVLCTGREIITLWVSRMVMFNRIFRAGVLPFRDVYIHPMIQDGHGQKMSKSLGNGVDPRDIIASHGADALRFILVKMATATQDVRLPVDVLCPHCGRAFAPREVVTSSGHTVAAPLQECPSCGGGMTTAYGAASGAATPDASRPQALNSSGRFDDGRNFANKVWNAARFALGALGEAGTAGAGAVPRRLVDRWMVTQLCRAWRTIEQAIAAYEFSAYADAMYDLVWRDFCDWYLESIKPTVGADAVQRQVLRTVLDAILRLLHPVCPFVTETLWPHLRELGEPGLAGVRVPRHDGPLARAPWPRIDSGAEDPGAEEEFTRIQGLVAAILNVRSEHRLPPRRAIVLHAPPQVLALVESGEGVVETRAVLGAVHPLGDAPAGAVPLSFEAQRMWLEGVVQALDVTAERSRLEKALRRKQEAVMAYRRRLANADYLARAPAQRVQETRELLERTEAELDAAQVALRALQEAATESLP